MKTYVAFLRGINVGGNKKVPMVDLKRAFEELEYTDIKTVLNTGNVIFHTDETKDLLPTISAKLEQTFGFAIPVIVWTAEDLSAIIKLGPFKNIEVTKETRLYVTILGDTPTSTLKIPYASSDQSFRILSVSHQTVLGVLDLSKADTPDAMEILEKEFGKNVTTRNWNTIQKIHALC